MGLQADTFWKNFYVAIGILTQTEAVVVYLSTLVWQSYSNLDQNKE